LRTSPINGIDWAHSAVVDTHVGAHVPYASVLEGVGSGHALFPSSSLRTFGEATKPSCGRVPHALGASSASGHTYRLNVLATPETLVALWIPHAVAFFEVGGGSFASGERREVRANRPTFASTPDAVRPHAALH
jgi:hypothetical protein